MNPEAFNVTFQIIDLMQGSVRVTPGVTVCFTSPPATLMGVCV